MKPMLTTSSLHVPLLLVALTACGVVACGSSDSSDPGPAATGGAGGTGGTPQDGGSGGGTGGTTQDGGSGGGTGGTTQDGGTGGTGGGGEDPFANPAFTGIDTSIVPAGIAPTGCDKGLDLSTGRLNITLDTQTAITLIGVVGTEIQANGVTCTASTGEAATTDNTSSIWITGSDASETLVVDLSTGSFGTKILAEDGGIHADLAGGDDAVMLRATTQDDAIRMGKSAAALVVALSPASTGDIWLNGVEKLVASLGPGADELRAGLDSGFDGAVDIPLAVFGDADNDTIEGGHGNDLLNGGPGDDTFDEGDASNGDDILNGGPDGGNTISYERRTAGLIATLCTSTSSDGCESPACTCGADDGQLGEKDNIINIHHFIGGSGGDEVTGTADDETLEGRNGDDYLYGLEGADTLLGSDGEDTLDSGQDSDKDNVDCGGGDADIAVADSSDDVLDCELW